MDERPYLHRFNHRLGACILDLMVSVDSHLADGLQPVSVVGLGTTREELNAILRRNERLAHELNPDPGLPFADASFNAVVCTCRWSILPIPWRCLRRSGGL